MIEANERREAAGEALWSSHFDSRARTRLQRLLETVGVAVAGQWWDDFAFGVSETVARQVGFEIVPDRRFAGDSLSRFIIAEGADEQIPSVLDAFMVQLTKDGSYEALAHDLEKQINEILSEHRIAFSMIGHHMIDFESQEMHEGVVAPTLRLLSGRPGWQKVESAYQEALREIGDDPKDAVTDAARALQGALRLLGCNGNSLGAQLKDAKRKRLLAPHDETLADGIGRIIDWVSADRAEKGSVHKEPKSDREDAWFAVHVVGALILRCTGEPRG